MNIADYKTLKALDAENSTENVKVVLVNGTPLLRVKKYNPDTGISLNEETEMPVDVAALHKQVETWKDAIANVGELIADAEALK